MPTLKEYYKSLARKDKSELVMKISIETDVAPTTFMQKIYANKSFRKLEREKMSEIIGIPQEELFPEVKASI